ncbi:CehA/McbA family metallohydrolase [Botrimarina mediterranea]|uniref:Carboxypeptidase regulatory-like domain-containing protein n=1 Tax=Botrimarina mediterranea TaxID=2528022 RepID=A0A518KBJ1_9BACT|nr:CehA/McbA family metallohydrolase [Botrimarina mediterranea]QDV75167.1 hypothetical protein Spa11_33800 [Botrimarina mediterranea]QDV79813.1 hypothetical protein K2D_34320 [Planctomycetes bacterium K2D]
MTRLVLVALVFMDAAGLNAAELQTLDKSNYDLLVPDGKEVDAIHGDFVLQNDKIIAVIGAPGPERDANLTVHNVGGGVIDLTERDTQSDQLSCFYPGGGGFKFKKRIDWPAEWGKPADGAATIAFEGEATAKNQKGLVHRVGYELRDGETFVRVVSTLKNDGEESVKAPLRDGWRLDGEFKFGAIEGIDLVWGHDLFWRQAYGVQSEEGVTLRTLEMQEPRRPRQFEYGVAGRDESGTLAAGDSVTWRRCLIPAADSLAVQATAYAMRDEDLATGKLTVTDGVDPVANALVTVRQDNQVVGYLLTDAQGGAVSQAPAGEYAVTISAEGHGSMTHEGSLEANPDEIDAEWTVPLKRAGYAEATITDGAGRAIPVKVQFTGLDGAKSPDFGPESAERGVKNVQYTPDGRFRCKLAPGRYKWVASYGPEHDAAYGEITVEAGETATIAAKLPRTVDTTGWLSSELHSHSSPSGDNTASQAGRVLNLLDEHLEFCPCTEHQRIDVYDQHLAAFDAQHRMLTCPGMELTGQPLPLNHQNAFPLKHHVHEQDGGGPQTDPNPVTQIKRLAEWDDKSEKLVQSNHPNTAQMVGDRDLNGEPDEGFEAMFGYMDVQEIHPPELIFDPLGERGDPNSGVGNGGWDNRGNAIQNWLQLLNLGYRVTGVVNTDAHYNFHGSGWMRNWVRSSTDDPAEASVMELVHEFEHGHVVVSNGPFMSVTARSAAQDRRALPGDDLRTKDGKATLRIVVRCPNWMEINRVQLFINGRPDPEHNYTVRSHGDWFGRGTEVFDREIEVELEEDAHLVVACCGEGRSIGPMYGVPEGKTEWGRGMPVAVANPVFVDTNGDVDGDGVVFEPNGDDLGLPLPRLEGRRPSHGHDHPNHHHTH